jgi:hypothetical protein
MRFAEGGAMKRQTGMFTARGSDNRSYTVYEYTDFLQAHLLDDPTAKIPGLKELRTADGAPVNFIEPGVYKIVANGVILRSNN